MIDAPLQPDHDAHPPNSLHLQLTPKHADDSQLTQIDLWYDRTTLLPMRVRTIDESENESIVEITETRLNIALDPAVVNSLPPSDPDWHIEQIPWLERQSIIHH